MHKRFPLVGILLLIPALALFVAVGCSPKPTTSKDNAGKDPAPKENANKDNKPAGEKTEITGETTGVVKGFVKLKGKAPASKPIPAMKEHKDSPVCLSDKAPEVDKIDQTWIVDNDGRVNNVIVWLAPASDKKYKMTDALREPFKKAVEIDQPFCQYRPHVVAILSETQPLVFLNTAKVAHNVKMEVTKLVGTTIDKNLPEGSKTEPQTFKVQSENIFDATCGMHGWMRSKVFVCPHPYFAVTDSKGEFKIENVPISSELTVYYWHESFGGIAGKKEAKKASFNKGDNPVEITIDGP